MCEPRVYKTHSQQCSVAPWNLAHDNPVEHEGATITPAQSLCKGDRSKMASAPRNVYHMILAAVSVWHPIVPMMAHTGTAWSYNLASMFQPPHVSSLHI